MQNPPLKSSGQRVLAVDDQPDSLRLLQRRLQAGGIECCAFPDGESALRFLERELVDVIILDVMMPNMDGYEVCRRLKQNHRTRDIPVIFLTAKLEPQDRVQGLELGGHDYLAKPIQQEELLARTRAALRVKQLQDQLREQIQLQEEIHQLHRGMLSEHWQKTFGQLAASLAHEINNPLAAALGTAQLLKLTKGIGPEVLEPLQIIDQSLQRAGQKLRSLLLIAQAGHLPQKISTARLVQDILTVINYQVVMNKIKIMTELEDGCEWEGPQGDMARALLYVLNNAIEAVVRRPDPRITIKLAKSNSDQIISVADNGVGIPEHIQARVFDPFFTTKGAAHHGIGLYLACEIIKSIGGGIEFRSPAANAATEFRIRLPLSVRPA